jgi:hypothetical protein
LKDNTANTVGAWGGIKLMSIARIIVGEHAGQNVVVVYKYEKEAMDMHAAMIS